jgi:DNA polymerase III epsilon subunit-like protein
MPLLDTAFRATTYVVIDFEALTPAGRPPEPIEVAAIIGRFTEDGSWKESERFTSLMRPPDDVPITSLDMCPGIAPAVLRDARPQNQVMAELDSRLIRPPYRLVAHSAGIEATLIARQRAHCPRLAATPLLCTVRLARKAWPDLPRHSLNACLRKLRIPEPPDRHRALADVEWAAPAKLEARSVGSRSPGQRRRLIGGTSPHTRPEERFRSKNVAFQSYTRQPIPWWQSSHP